MTVRARVTDATTSVRVRDGLPDVGGLQTPAERAPRIPTERQYRTLLSLGSGAALLSHKKRDTEALLRRGWVTADWKPPYYQWVRITAAGLHALALAVEKFGLPEMKGGSYHARVCSNCLRDWKPRCKCGSQNSHYQLKEVERDAA